VWCTLCVFVAGGGLVNYWLLTAEPGFSATVVCIIVVD